MTRSEIILDRAKEASRKVSPEIAEIVMLLAQEYQIAVHHALTLEMTLHRLIKTEEAREKARQKEGKTDAANPSPIL